MSTQQYCFAEQGCVILQSFTAECTSHHHHTVLYFLFANHGACNSTTQAAWLVLCEVNRLHARCNSAPYAHDPVAAAAVYVLLSTPVHLSYSQRWEMYCYVASSVGRPPMICVLIVPPPQRHCIACTARWHCDCVLSSSVVGCSIHSIAVDTVLVDEGCCSCVHTEIVASAQLLHHR